MARKLMASERKSLIRMASSLPAGSEDRRAILSALKKAQTFNPARTGHKYDIHLESVDNRDVKEYGSDGGGTSGIDGRAYVTGTVDDSSRDGLHPFKVVLYVQEEPRSGTMLFHVHEVYGYSADARMNAEIAAHVLTDSYAAQRQFRRMLGKPKYVPGPGEPGYRRRW